jgi:SAM-dependent methyltransferase
MHCLLCQSTNHKKREGKVRDNPHLEIWECCECGLVFLSHVEHIDETFYKKENLPLYSNIDAVETSFDVITAFHVIEHLPNPHEILKKLKKLLNNKGKLIIEVPNANDALLTLYKSKAFSQFTYWSCHLYLYTAHTLKFLAQQCGFEVEFIKHVQRYPLSNHLYWLSCTKPGGHEKWGELLDSKALSKAYEAQLASLEATDTIIACLVKG